MASVFAALEDQLSAACDATFGEQFEMRPMKYGAGGGRRAPDPDRTTATITGIFEAPIYKSTEFGTEARGSMPALLNRTMLSVAAQEFSAFGPPRQYDVAARLSTGDIYEISVVERDAEGRYRLGIKQIGKE